MGNLPKNDIEKIFDWLNKEVLLKIVADFFKQNLTWVLIIIIVFLLRFLKSTSIFISLNPWVLSLLIFLLIVLLIIYIIQYRELKIISFRNEFETYSHLRYEIKKAKKEINILGHACANIFYIREDLEKALKKGVDINVFIQNPHFNNKKPKYLKEESMPSLLKHLQKKEKIPNEFVYGLTETSENDFKLKLPIILSLVYGWYPFFNQTKLDQEKYKGKMEVKLYSSNLNFKAFIIDHKSCFFGNYNFPLQLPINDHQELYKDQENIKKVVEILEKIRKDGTSIEFTYQERTLWRNKLYQVANFQSLKIFDC